MRKEELTENESLIMPLSRDANNALLEKRIGRRKGRGRVGFELGFKLIVIIRFNVFGEVKCTRNRVER